eukprot:730939-Lingulodinium_polyedra.AAC.1
MGDRERAGRRLLPAQRGARGRCGARGPEDHAAAQRRIPEHAPPPAGGGRGVVRVAGLRAAGALQLVPPLQRLARREPRPQQEAPQRV